ncbi:MAG TPA: SAF domain-containing protein [Acidimicrobiales bacterium]
MSSLGAPTLLALRARRLVGRRRWRRGFVVALALLTAAVVAGQVRAVEAARRRWDETRVVAVARRDLAPGEVVSADTVEQREVVAASVAPAALEEVPLGSVVRHPVASGEPLVPARLAPEGLTGLAALVPAGERAVAVPVGPAGRPPLAVGDRVDVLAVTALDPLASEAAVDAPWADVDAADGSAGESDGDAGDDEVPPGAGDPDDPDGPDDLGAGVEQEARGDPPERPARAPGGAAGVVPLVDRALVVDVADEVVTVAVPAALAPAVAAAVTQGAVVLTLTGA